MRDVFIVEVRVTVNDINVTECCTEILLWSFMPPAAIHILRS
jgi:hypothetical protein